MNLHEIENLCTEISAAHCPPAIAAAIDKLLAQGDTRRAILAALKRPLDRDARLRLVVEAYLDERTK